MTINAILLDEKDNVVTCVKTVEAGEAVAYMMAGSMQTVCVVETIPIHHKVALCDLGDGDSVIKYGELIGKTNKPVAKGGLVNEHNIYSVPRDYDSELVAIN